MVGRRHTKQGLGPTVQPKRRWRGHGQFRDEGGKQPKFQKWNIPTTLVLYQISASGTQTKVRDMGCSNKMYALQQTFFCTGGCYTHAGFVADPTAASGCSLDSDEIGRTKDESGDSAQGQAALIFGIVCGCVVLVVVAGCVYVTLRKKRHGAPKQEPRPKRCDPDDLETADCQTQTEPEFDKRECEKTSESAIAGGSRLQSRTLQEGASVASNEADHSSFHMPGKGFIGL